VAEATYDAPVARTKTGVRVSSVQINRAGPSVQVTFEVLDGSDDPMDGYSESVSLGGGEVGPFLAIVTSPDAYPGEPANAGARTNWRVIKACKAAGYLVGLSQS